MSVAKTPVSLPKPRFRLSAGAGISLFVLVMVCAQLLPFYVAITTSFKSLDDLSSQIVFPFTHPHWSNFVSAVTEGGMLRAMLNSAIVTLATTVLVCLLGAAAAYPLARQPSRLNKLIYALIIALMMIPALSILVPLYSFLADIHALNTYWGEILVMTTGQLPVSIFLYTSFMRAVPLSVEEAAHIDGANKLQALWWVVVPLLRPVTSTVAIMCSVAVWNEYALSGYILSDPQMYTIAPAIASFLSTQSHNLPAATAAALLGVVPVVIAYVFLQKHFVQGMVGMGK